MKIRDDFIEFRARFGIFGQAFYELVVPRLRAVGFPTQGGTPGTRLQVPEKVICPQRSICDGTEALCIVLRYRFTKTRCLRRNVRVASQFMLQKSFIYHFKANRMDYIIQYFISNEINLIEQFWALKKKVPLLLNKLPFLRLRACVPKNKQIPFLDSWFEKPCQRF